MKVLAIGAHPDDIENLCAGTLARCAERGDEITIAIATNGDVGSPLVDADKSDIARRREAEARASADIIGASVIWMGFPDEFLFNDRTSREAFIDAIRTARPDLMFIHSETDYHPDHRIAGQIARDCRIPASVPLVRTALGPADIPTTFLMDTIKGRNFEPELYVDITAVMGIKEEMLAEHVSQQEEWMRDGFGIDMADDMRIQSRFRGSQAGFVYAEAFRLLNDWPAAKDGRLLP